MNTTSENDHRLWAMELEIAGPMGSRLRRAQMIVRIVADAEQVVTDQRSKGDPASISDELLDLLNRVSTSAAKRLVMDSLEYVRQDVELTQDVGRYLKPSTRHELQVDQAD